MVSDIQPGVSVENIVEKAAEIPIKAAVSDAELLLAYATSHGIAIEPDVVATVVSSKALLSQDDCGPDSFEMQTKFWGALQSLSKAVQPVTIFSLKASTQKVGRDGWMGPILDRIFGERFSTEAEWAVRRLRRVAFVALLALVAVQIYWGVGLRLTTEMAPLIAQSEENTKQHDKLMAEGKTADSAEIQDLDAVDITLQREMTVRYEILEKWNYVWRSPLVFVGLFHEKQADAGGPYASLKKAILVTDFTSQAIRLYVLPLLYGLLGACLYVLRTLSNDIRSLSYTSAQKTLYRLRVYMGTLAGLVIGWFLQPIQAPTDLQYLTPFALALLAGYSVDLLFAVMDRLIAAFSGK